MDEKYLEKLRNTPGIRQKLEALRNVSDFRGVAIEGVEGEPVTLTTDLLALIAIGFVYRVADYHRRPDKPQGLRIAIGYDSRLSGPAIAQFLSQIITQCGCPAINLGVTSTPSVVLGIGGPGPLYEASIMVTASHLPVNRNGLKFFSTKGSFTQTDAQQIISYALEKECHFGFPREPENYYDFALDYAHDRARRILERNVLQQPLENLKIVLDAGNGAGGFYATVLEELGADVSESFNLLPDGRFPNGVPNPENPESLKPLQQKVIQTKADFGVILDPDADRAALVNHDGSVLNRNKFVALMAAIVLEEAPGSIIVTDSITSNGLTYFIEKVLHGKHHRFKRGYRNVIEEAKRINSERIGTCWLAIETSGHAALFENHFLDDGPFAMLKILLKAYLLRREGKQLSDLIAQMPEPVESREFRIKIQTPDFKTYGNQIIKELGAYAQKQEGWQIAPKNYEGIRVSLAKEQGDGWFLLRLSLHDPKIVINVESDSAGGVKKIAAQLACFLEKYEKIDAQKLEN